MTELKQNDKVTFNLNDKVVGLTGKVCGKLGPIYIVKLDNKLQGYDYTHIYITDGQIVDNK